MRLIFLLMFLAGPTWAADCHRDVPCQLGDRSYHVREPDGWDGVSPLPVLLHFHGWQRQGDLIVNHRRISGATRLRGVLLVAPNGQNRTWNFFRAETPDVAFAEAVLADVAARYPVNADEIYVSGYSFGSAMAWRFACETEVPLRALLAIAGTLRQDAPCPNAPSEVRHVHGLSDTVMDFPFGPGGDQTYPVKLWRDRLGCSGPGSDNGTWAAVEFLTHSQVRWEDCADGVRVVLDTHSGGHFIPHGWIARHLDELAGREPTYP